jgi:hypothetical protein
VTDRYPGYDVLRKRNSPSWNDQTRGVIDRRLAIDADCHRFFDDKEWCILRAIIDRIVPQPADRESPVPVAAMLDVKLSEGHGDGYRDARMPEMREAWRIGLQAIDAESQRSENALFTGLSPERQDHVLAAIQNGKVEDETSWHGMPPALFFSKRVLHDLTSLYYAHPTAWNEIGFGGPASPRGYVRMNFNRRDPWEAAEAKPGRESEARKENSRVA